MTTGGYTLIEAPRPKQKLVHVHAGPEELGRVYAADLLIQSSMATAAMALEGLEAPSQVSWVAWADEVHAAFEANRVSTPVPGPLDMAEVVKTMERVLHESGRADAIFTNGAGNYSGWLHRYYRYGSLAHTGRTQLAPTSGAMGYGVPAAVAASVLQPGRTVVNVAGDGDFLMNGQELATATGYGARPIVLVVDNGTYGTIRMHQEREYPGRVSGSDLFNPDFAALARAYGWHGRLIAETAEFEPAFREALDRREPTLLHLKLDAQISTSRATLSQLRGAAKR